MSISIDHDKRIFSLNTAHTTYQMMADEHGLMHHVYYGRSIRSFDMSYQSFYSDCGFSPNPYELRNQRDYSLDTRSQEYTGCGIGDYRISCIRVGNSDGSYSADLRYAGFQELAGKYAIPGMPASYDNGGQCQSLRIDLKDAVSGLEVSLYYGVFEQQDMITRCAVIRNGGSGTLRLYKAASACLDLPFGKWDLIHFHGRHCMERMPERMPVPNAVQTIGSNRGTSSHQHNPFVILAAPEATEDFGECYGAMLVYSGNFKIEAEYSQLRSTRVVAGISDDRFCWQLEQNENFYTPEVLLSYTGGGLTALSHQYQDFLAQNICRGPYKNSPRPVLINNWEATYFDFNARQIYQIARQAKELGVEMLVLDDGWYGKRNDDTSGLGDWYVNEEKLGCTLAELIRDIKALDMKFGLWVEPEMVSSNSDLYKVHPDWALQVPGRAPTIGRGQLVLDMSREDGVEYLYRVLSDLLNKHDIDYIKWDMNRHLSDVYSLALPPRRQGEVYHRYMLGVYALLERLTQEHPQVLFEGCSGGGGRFDAGMLYYHPQIWCSDDTDAIERLRIQYGTSFGYPIRAMGSHVSACPNHQTGRSTPLNTRAVVAMSGTFGYELDPNILTDVEKDEIRRQIRLFKRYQPLISQGNYFRLTNAMTDGTFTAWQFAAKDQSSTLVNVVVVSPAPNPYPIHIRLKGLDPEGRYRESGSGKEYSGAALMYGGYTLPILFGDYPAIQLYFERV